MAKNTNKFKKLYHQGPPAQLWDQWAASMEIKKATGGGQSYS